MLQLSLQERNERCGEFFGRCQAILDRKGADYTVAGDALKEITQLAEQLSITPEQVLWVYMYKHLSALLNWLQAGALQSEDVSERLVDIANYCALMSLFVREAVAGPAASDDFAACDRLAASLHAGECWERECSGVNNCPGK